MIPALRRDANSSGTLDGGGEAEGGGGFGGVCGESVAFAVIFALWASDMLRVVFALPKAGTTAMEFFAKTLIA